VEKTAPYSIQIIAMDGQKLLWRATLIGSIADMEWHARQTIMRSLLDVQDVTDGWTRLEIQTEGTTGSEDTSELLDASGNVEF
jgi:hypothetical protein